MADRPTYTSTDWQRYEPPAIKAVLPVEWVVGHLFQAWGMGDDMSPCPLPGHQDDTPSANLWAEDEAGNPQRFGCFGCGVNEDVIGLIRIARNVGFTEACTIAVDELVPAFAADRWEPTERQPATRHAAATPQQLEEVLRSLQVQEVNAVPQFHDRKGLHMDRTYTELIWEWGSIATPAPTVYFPHRDWDGRLTGIRFRSVRRDGTRWTERGSRFPALYGAHLDRGYADVLLTEGETDTVHAAWQVRVNDSAPLDVLGLASGAAQKPPAEAIAHLQGRRVFTAFDGDLAGKVATERWHQALREVTDFVYTCPVPDGEDVLSCRIPVLELVGAAR